MQDEIQCYEYYFNDKFAGDVKIIYDPNTNKFSPRFSMTVSNHNREWFSRICLAMNTYLSKGYDYKRIELTICPPDKNGKISVEVETSETIQNSFIQVLENGNFFHYDKNEKRYKMLYDPELLEIFEKIQNIINKKQLEINLE